MRASILMLGVCTCTALALGPLGGCDRWPWFEPEEVEPIRDIPNEPAPQALARYRLALADARALAAAGRVDEARACLYALRNDPGLNTPELALELSELALAASDQASAARELDSARRGGINTARGRYVVARVALARGDHEQAMREFRAAAELDPNGLYGTLAAGELARQLADSDEPAALAALRDFDRRVGWTSSELRFEPRVVELSTDPVLQGLRGRMLTRPATDGPAQPGALPAWREITPSGDGRAARDFLALLGRGEARAQLLAACRSWLASSGPDAASDFQLVSALGHGIARLESAEERGALLDALLSPALPPARVQRAARLCLANLAPHLRVEEIERLASALSATDRQVATVARVRAALFGGAGRDAVEVLSTQLAAHPFEFDFLVALVYPVDPLDEGAHSYPPAIAADDPSGADSPAHKLGETIVSLALGDPTRALALQPEQCGKLRGVAHWVRAAARTRRYDWRGAQADLDIAARHSPRSAAVHFLRGLILAAQDRLEAAGTSFRAALAADPSEPRYPLELARSAPADSAEALTRRRTWLRQAVELAPLCDTPAEFLLAVLTPRQGEAAERAEAEQLVADVAARPWPSNGAARMAVELDHVDQRGSPAHLAAYESLARSQPGDRQTRARLLELRVERRRIDDAVQLAREVAATPDPADNELHLMADAHKLDLDFGPAITHRRTLIARYPERMEQRFDLVVLLLNAMRPEEVRREVAALRAARSDLSAEQLARLSNAEFLSYVQFGDFEGALRWVDARSAAGEVAPHRMARERLLLAAGRRDEFLRSITAALDRSPFDERARAEFIHQCRFAGEWDVALARAREWAASDNPGVRLRAGLELADHLLNARRPDEALAAFAAVAAMPELRNAELNLPQLALFHVRAYLQQGRTDEASKAIDDLLARPDVRGQREALFDARGKVIEYCVENRAFEFAAQYLDRWEAGVGDDRDARMQLLALRGGVLQSAGREREPEWICVAERQLELDPDDVNLHNNLGYTWLVHGRNVDRAFELVRGAAGEEPLNTAPLDSLAWAYYVCGDFARSLDLLRRATALWDGRDPVMFEHRGDAAHRVGDLAFARESWVDALLLAQDPTKHPRVVEILQPFRIIGDSLSDAARDDVLCDRLWSKIQALDAGRRPELSPTEAEMNR